MPAIVFETSSPKKWLLCRGACTMDIHRLHPSRTLLSYFHYFLIKLTFWLGQKLKRAKHMGCAHCARSKTGILSNSGGTFACCGVISTLNLMVIRNVIFCFIALDLKQIKPEISSLLLQRQVKVQSKFIALYPGLFLKLWL